MFETITPEQDDRGSLVEFIIQVKRFLLLIAYEGYLAQVEWQGRRFDFEDEHLALYRRALDEYVESRRFEMLLDAVRELSDDRIADGGLGGAQLFLKRETIRVTERRFRLLPSIPGFRRLLQAIDVLLNSLLSATGAGSAIEELKDLAGLLPQAQGWPS